MGGGFQNDYANAIFALSSNAEFDYGREGAGLETDKKRWLDNMWTALSIYLSYRNLCDAQSTVQLYDAVSCALRVYLQYQPSLCMLLMISPKKLRIWKR